MLNLKDLIKEQQAVVPIKDNSFQYHNKKYYITKENGWYKVSLCGNKVKILEPIFDFTDIKKNLDIAKGCIYNNLFIFNSFDSAKRKWNSDITKELLFNNQETFSPVEAVVWEDKNLYLIGSDYTNFKVLELKNAYDNDIAISKVKGITPELKTLYLFHHIERENALKVLEEKKVKESIPHRLKQSLEAVGAILTNYSVSGHRITVYWEIIGGTHKYISVIDALTFKILEAGYCLSNDDRRHNVTSLVVTAKDFEKRRVIHQTITEQNYNRDYDEEDYD